MSQILVGRIGRPHGVHGELSLDASGLDAVELHGVKEFVWRGRRGEQRLLRLRTARPAHARVLVTFEGIETREEAAELVNGELLADSERIPDAGPGLAYRFQLVGLEVRTEEGRVLGRLVDIFDTGAHPVYVVRGERELMVPASPEVLRRVDLQAGVITVALPLGLEEAQ